jgi:ribosomal-protein-alanine N-acetyltransferase
LFGAAHRTDMQNKNSSSFPVLKTTRLVLRKLVLADAADLLKLRSDDRVNQYLNRPKTISADEAVAFINKIDAAIVNGQSYYWVISADGENRLIGTICLWNIDTGNSRVEVGYELHPDFQGKGFMQEALLKVIDFAFNVLLFKKITAYTTVVNEKSIKLLEKNNFTRDYAIEHEFHNAEPAAAEIVYSLSSP